MKKKVSFLKLLISVYIFLVFTISIFISIVSINNSKQNFLDESEDLIDTSSKIQKDLVQKEVNNATEDLKKYASSIEIKSNELLKTKVYNSYNFIESIYLKYKDSKSKNDIVDIIKTVLRSAHTNEQFKSDYFIIDLDGNAILFNNQLKIENTNLLNCSNSKKKYIFKEMISLAKDKNEGFYSCDLSSDDLNKMNIGNTRSSMPSFERVSYLKLFKPLNFFVATSFFKNDFKTDLKKSLLKKIKKIRFGERNSGYITVISRDGIILTTDERQSKMVGMNINELFDNKGKNIYKELLRASFSNNGNGGFATYNWLDPSRGVISEKITFVKKCNNFGWMIAGGIYLNDIGSKIEELKINLEKELDDSIFNIILTTVISIIILLLFIFIINLRLKRDYYSLNSFLKNLISKNEKINVDKIRFTEVEEIVLCANEMLDEKLRSDKNLIESEEKFRTLTNSTNIGVVLHQNKEILYANKVIVNVTGFTEDQLMKMTFFDLIHEDSIEFFIDNYEKMINGENSLKSIDIKINAITANTNNDKEPIWISITVNEIIYKDNSTYLVSALDITSRKSVENQLFRERERLKVALESIGDGVITTSIEGVIRYINVAGSEITGYTLEEAVGKDLTDIFNIYYEDDKRKIINPLKKVKLTKEKTVFIDHPLLLSKNDKELRISNTTAPMIDKSGKIDGIVIVFRDLTEFIDTEDELQRMRKLESLEVLAGGIAHDFNNLLTGIFGNLTIAKLHSPKSEKSYEHIETAEKAMAKAVSLSNQLSAFSKTGDPEKIVTNMEIFVKESAEFSLSGSNVKLNFEVKDDLLLTEVDQGLLNQVISNIVINASQSMCDNNRSNDDDEGRDVSNNGKNLYLEIKNESKISSKNNENNVNNNNKPQHIIKTSNIESKVATFIKKSRYNDFVRITFRDEGEGIEKKFLSKIFDPYYTTKKKGKGLGLASSHSIMNKHKGQIFVDSEKGIGTEFTLLLPASREITERIMKENEEIEDNFFKSSWLPKEMKVLKVLIMDDELSLRNVLGEMISILGHDPHLTSDGKELLDRYKTATDENSKFDLVFMDLTIPGGMGGEETIKQLLLMDPDAKAIVASGYQHNSVMINYKKHGFINKMSKPFRIDILKKMLESVDSKI